MPMTAGLPSVIKSIQRGVISLASVSTNTATVTAVVTSKSTLNHCGDYTGTTTTNDGVHIVLTNSTTITALRPTSTGNAAVSWELIEYY